MRKYMKRIAVFSTLALSVALLVSCGGGGGFSGNGAIIGTAATGLPITGAQVFLVDSKGNSPAGQTDSIGVATTDENGNYTIDASKIEKLAPPFMLRVLGTTTSESGDTVAAVFHAVSNLGEAQNRVNLTPLTELHTALTLKGMPAKLYDAPATSLTNFSINAANSANTELATKLAPVIDFATGPVDFVRAPLDATPNKAYDSSARKHDSTLDGLSFSTSDGSLVLADRNQDEDNYATGPRITVNASAGTATLSGKFSDKPASSASNVISAASANSDTFESRLNLLAERMTNALKSTCTINSTKDTSNCDTFLNDPTIFSTSFKDKGMSPWRATKGWVSDALDTNTLTGATVSVQTPSKGTYPINGVEVKRVVFKWTLGNDVLFRTAIVKDDQSTVVLLGNQKDYMLWFAPSISYNPDADNVYPYYPKYQVGPKLLVKHWYMGTSFVIFGAEIKGPGLPSSGVNVWDRFKYGCSNLAVDWRIYANRNLNGQPTRFDSTNTSCDPTFDFARYDSPRDAATSGFVYPKAGDVYSVKLYLDKSKFTTGGGTLTLPSGVGPETTVTTADGDTKTVYPYVVSYTLRGDSFTVPDSNFDPTTFGFPGLKDSNRTNLKNLSRGSDLAIEWTRFKSTLSDGSIFVSFNAGRYMHSYDALRTADADCFYNNRPAGQNKTSGCTGLLRTAGNNPDNLPIFDVSNTLPVGAGTTAYRGGDIRRYLNSANNARYNARIREKYSTDRFVLVPSNATSRTLRWSEMLEREAQEAMNVCSAYEGFWLYRKSYVIMSDINGRMIQENREVYGDYPNMTVPNGFNVPSRPYRDTDSIYLANTSTNTDFGFIHPVKKKSADLCVDKVWADRNDGT